MTAYDTEPGLVLSQKPTKNKHSEMSVVRQLIDVINVKDSVITVDALHCQRDTLEKIAEKKGLTVLPMLKGLCASIFIAVVNQERIANQALEVVARYGGFHGSAIKR